MARQNSPQHVNAKGVIDPYREMHYRFHQRIDPSIFPQIHDFYELTLVTSGTMYFEVNGTEEILAPGALVLLRPGDIHARHSPGECTYINLAFPTQVMVDMFRYLDDPETYNRIVRMPQPTIVALPAAEMALLRGRLEKLNLLPIDRPQLTCAHLRWLMLDIVLEYIVPSVSLGRGAEYPAWLRAIIRHMEEPENFSGTLDDLALVCDRSKAHICRGFRKYLGVSPSEYVNNKRLNYAANLLLYSDKQVIDVAYASGFQSLSRFYHAFKQTFHVSPLEYRRGSQHRKEEILEK